LEKSLPNGRQLLTLPNEERSLIESPVLRSFRLRSRCFMKSEAVRRVRAGTRKDPLGARARARGFSTSRTSSHRQWVMAMCRGDSWNIFHKYCITPERLMHRIAVKAAPFHHALPRAVLETDLVSFDLYRKRRSSRWSYRSSVSDQRDGPLTSQTHLRRIEFARRSRSIVVSTRNWSSREPFMVPAAALERNTRADKSVATSCHVRASSRKSSACARNPRVKSLLDSVFNARVCHGSGERTRSTG